MAQSCGYPDTMNKKESYSPLKKKKKPNKKYNKLADFLNVDTVTDTIIGPSKSSNVAQQRGNSFERMKKYDFNKGGIQSMSTPNTPRPKGIRNKRNTEYYTIHKK
jgi:hypothetical protein